MVVEVDAVCAAITTAITAPWVVELVESHVNVEHRRVLEHEAAMTTLVAAELGRSSRVSAVQSLASDRRI